jgi:hypothetical protein
MENKEISMRYLFILVIAAVLLSGCDNEPIKGKEPTFRNEQIEKEFSVYMSKSKSLIAALLRKNGITPEPLEADEDWLSWDVSEQTLEQKQHGKCDSIVFIWGTKKVYDDIKVPTCIVLYFLRENNSWNLLLSNGYVAGNEREDGEQSLSPEMHMSFKRLFPNHIDIKTL